LEYVVYQPKDLAGAEAKGKLGVYVWGSGGCSADAASSRFHLTEIASNGYVVIVPGKILSGPKAPPEGNKPASGMPSARDGATAEKMVAGIDWILAENLRQGSPYFHAIDTSRIAVAGFSCGGLIAIKAAMDPRVSALLIESSGILKNVPAAMTNFPQMTSLKKEDLAKLHTPALYVLGGPEDIAEPNGLDDFEHIDKVPVFVADQAGAGHGGLISVPHAEGTKVELDWLDWQLKHDAVAARTFIGPDCTLCRDFRWQVHRKGIQ
jgi:predicted peptidase